VPVHQIWACRSDNGGLEGQLKWILSGLGHASTCRRFLHQASLRWYKCWIYSPPKGFPFAEWVKNNIFPSNNSNAPAFELQEPPTPNGPPRQCASSSMVVHVQSMEKNLQVSHMVLNVPCASFQHKIVKSLAKLGFS
jgi:hypothetical protein